ncbi:long-chain-fatty-acid--CoA ligase [Gordonia sp. HNM0687]|uniref:Long-chain-fatty-acid--CoA ligase n=1 Tax=Gordonia mangrovi TaxID=2665643 RepID=A0A6L7GIR5_9ACTN|nr:long-chain fatty acid--CoA ligase [Gordonia mangrovi]MXP19829.1 long-chain-fatty-acid--CoA ligase [Gordonia mangrovi]UVF79545.1 long-chain fatty acid--CoA ligase [Gordonia mangrovi]
MNLTNNLRHTAEDHPDVVAIKLDDTEITYAQLSGLAAKTAQWLRDLGVKPGDRVAVSLPNIPHMPVLYYGILWAGGVVVPMNPLYKDREFAHVLSDSGATAFFAWNGVAEQAAKGAAEAGVQFIEVDPATFVGQIAAHATARPTARDDDDTAVILYTSGTTGAPKGAELTHANMVRNAEVCADDRLIGLSAGDMVFGGLPLFHVFGQTCMMNAAVLTGATLTLLPRFDPQRALEIIERDKVTHMGGVPTMFVALSQYPDRDRYDTSSLTRCVSGGSALPVEVLSAFEDTYGAMVLEGYGLSETSPVASFNHADRERKPGSVGQPIEGVELKLVDPDWNEVPEGSDGEIVIKGHNVMKGYFNNPNATDSVMHNGWFRTGDIGRRDEDGYYYIVDRAKDMIIRGGYNVYPREIEEVLYTHPAVGSAAVVGIPSQLHGEEIAAVITLKPGMSVTEDEISEFAKERVAAYKYPRVVRIVDALPLGPTGKILKREITVS